MKFGPSLAQVFTKFRPSLEQIWTKFRPSLEASLASKMKSLLEAPRRPKSIKHRVQMMLRIKKVKMLIFYTSPLQNHYFGVPMEAMMEPKYGLEWIFTAIETDDRKAMLFRTPWETFLHLEPPAEERRVQPQGLKIGPRVCIDIYMYISIYNRRGPGPISGATSAPPARVSGAKMFPKAF